MILYPAIDIYQGKCVRLAQGDFNQAKVYFENPVDAAKKWVDEGAQWLHVVDLNAAVEGHPINVKAIEEIMTSVDVPVQIGGGIRNEETAEIFLTLGAGRIVIGSAVIEDPDLLQILCTKFENRVALGIDAKDGLVAVKGWKEITSQEALKFAQELESNSPACIIYTDISRDGMLTGPNFEAIQKMVNGLSTPLIASGGISSLDDLKKLKEIGVTGAILGKALYEGKINLLDALQTVS
ncbi:MAG: 1-(5-phosphoribosyl)-5-[(5-phosphoribosylamino)methylideneamino]imidazole-4-carboxamide isomerase [Deltaproteobacteria bacterium]|nr:1-(5-phosphoribosyl)-5-[(5-phosphoribosylamino)methylideneamino]imidazole-4-carboxamide isomerase [Deltaproteobacteria bacterium]